MALGRAMWRWPPILMTMMIIGLGACRDPAPAASDAARSPYVLQLDARSADSFDGRGHAAWLEDAVTAELAASRYFAAEGPGPSLIARLRYEQLTAEDDVPVLRVRLLVEPDPPLAAELDAVHMVLDAHVELERRDHTIELRRDLPIAVERALALLDAKVTSARGTEDDLRALLHDTDPEVVLVALDGVERRALRALGDDVHALLEHPEEAVALRAVECLGVVGGPQHTPGLVRAARLADRAHANRLYDALARMGGDYARGFLAFAARNEEDPELALRAEQALAHLDATEPPPTPDPVGRGHRQ